MTRLLTFEIPRQMENEKGKTFDLQFFKYYFHYNNNNIYYYYVFIVRKTKGTMAPEIGPKRFGTFGKQAPCRVLNK